MDQRILAYLFLKSHKYISKKWKNGRWVYTYKNSQSQPPKKIQPSSKNTAIARKSLARPIAKWIESGHFEEARTILDYGGGRGDNARYLKEKFPNAVIHAYDPNHDNDIVTSDRSKLLPKYDLVISSYVMNVVDTSIQNKITKDIQSLSGGKTLIATRDDIISEMKKSPLYKGMPAEELMTQAQEGYRTKKDAMQRLVMSIKGFAYDPTTSQKGSWKTFIRTAN